MIQRWHSPHSVILASVMAAVAVVGIAAPTCAQVTVPDDWKTRHRPPLILALDGFSPVATATFRRRQPYLKPTFEGSRNVKAMGVEPSDILTLPWSGDIKDTALTVMQLEAFIPNLLSQATREGRSFIVVAHSWGTVLAYRALRGLEEGGRLAPGSVAFFLTLGSPLGGGSNAWAHLPPADRPGHNLTKLQAVRRWNNYFSTADGVISGPISIADSNVPLPSVQAHDHSAYYENTEIREMVAADMAVTIGKQEAPIAISPSPRTAPFLGTWRGVIRRADRSATYPFLLEIQSRGGDAIRVKLSYPSPVPPPLGPSTHEVRVTGSDFRIVYPHSPRTVIHTVTPNGLRLTAEDNPSATVLLTKDRVGQERAAEATAPIARNPAADTPESPSTAVTNVSSGTGLSMVVTECPPKNTYRSSKSVRVDLPASFDLTKEDSARGIVDQAVAFGREQCRRQAGPQESVEVSIYHPGFRQGREPAAGAKWLWSTIGSPNPGAVNGNTLNYFNKIWHERHTAEAAQRQERELREREQQQQTAARAADEKAKLIRDEFIMRYRVQTWPTPNRFLANPFQFEGQVLGFLVQLNNMRTPTEALVGWQHIAQILVIDMPKGLFKGEDWALLAAKFTATTDMKTPFVQTPIMKVAFVGARVCEKKGCTEVAPPQ